MPAADSRLRHGRRLLARVTATGRGLLARPRLMPLAVLGASVALSLTIDRSVRDGAALATLSPWPDGALSERLPAHPLAPVEIEPWVAGPPLPMGLAPEDVARYRRIFAAQGKADWDAADREIATLDDRALMGHVLFERYLHPTSYRSRFDELRDWLAAYRDHPGAARIYRLALRRKGADESEPVKPLIPDYGVGLPLRPAVDPTETALVATGDLLGGGERAFRARVSAELDQGRIGAALRLTGDARDRNAVSARALHLVDVDVAAAMLYAGRDREAFRRAAASAAQLGDSAPLADWIAGLAAWRLGDFARAAGHFATLAGAGTALARDRAAGAYWAARAYRELGREEAANGMLVRAAVQSYTFYGVLATQRLFGRLGIVARAPRLVASEVERLIEIPGVQRAMALTQVGRRDLAAAELAALSDHVDIDLARAMLALAVALELPEIQFDLGHRLLQVGSPSFNAVSYPVPPWTPDAGFAVDRALVYAVMRRESRFRPGATSRAGARGLMQLMPATASYLADDRTLATANIAKLYDPGYNVALGQRYLAELLEDTAVEQNLLRLAVAYNAGPTRLRQWLDQVDHRGDPLLFIETLPAAETRLYVRRVMANLWLYRARLGQPAPSLAALARDQWPQYTAHDLEALLVARNGQ